MRDFLLLVERNGSGPVVPTKLIDIFVVLAHFLCKWDNKSIVMLTDWRPALGKDDQFVPWDAILLDCLSNNLFRLAV